MNNNPVLSIVISSRNNGHNLNECLESVQRQTFQDFEIIIVDSGSSDRSLKIIEEWTTQYPGIVRAILNPDDQGMVRHIKEAIEQSRGSFLTTLDANDYYADCCKLEREMNVVQDHQAQGEVAIAFSDVSIIGEDRVQQGLSSQWASVAEGNILASILTRTCLVPRDFVMPRQAYFAVGGHDPEILLYEDWDLKIRLAEHYPFYYCDIVGTAHRQNHRGVAIHPWSEHRAWLERVFEKNLPRIPIEEREELRVRFAPSLAEIDRYIANEAFKGKVVICNGAFKSGSTWLFCLLRGLLPEIEPVPAQFQQQGEWMGQAVSKEKLSDFLSQVDPGKVYLIKSHFDDASVRDILFADDRVLIFNIERDLRDAIVSAYYHYRRLKLTSLNFSDYYWHQGRGLINYLKQYHKLWQDIPGKVYVSSYERLQHDFKAEVKRIASFLGLMVTDTFLTRLAQSVSLDILRAKWGESERPEAERFFRKGGIGDWRTHFSAEIAADFDYLDHSPHAAAQAYCIDLVLKKNQALQMENEMLRTKVEDLLERLRAVPGEVNQIDE